MAEVQTTDPAIQDSPEYIQEMVDKTEAEEKLGEPTPTEEPTEVAESQERPDWLPQKFKSPEDMAKAYGELESKLGSTEKPSSDPQEAPTEAATAPASEDEAKGMLKEQGLDYSKYEKEFVDTGEISQDSYQELADSGLSREFVDGYVNGQQSLAEANRRDAHEVVGGEAQFHEMIQWAGNNLSQDEITQYNGMLGNNKEQNRFAVRSMAALWRQEAGFAPDLIHGKPNTMANGYSSWAQVSEAMRDKRYQNDPAYRRNVELKVSQSATLDN